jgi:hypothetical protein
LTVTGLVRVSHFWGEVIDMPHLPPFKEHARGSSLVSHPAFTRSMNADSSFRVAAKQLHHA